MPVTRDIAAMAASRRRRARPDFTPSKTKGCILRLDCVAGRAKIVGHANAASCSRARCRFNIDIANIKAGWLDFQANAESAIVGTDRNNPPPGAGAKDGPKWGVEVRVAMPYATTFDDVEIEKVAALPDPNVDGAPARGAGNAVGCLRRGHQAQGRRHRFVEVAGWETVTKAGGKKYFRPRFKILGYVKDLEEAVRGRINNDDADAD